MILNFSLKSFLKSFFFFLIFLVINNESYPKFIPGICLQVKSSLTVCLKGSFIWILQLASYFFRILNLKTRFILTYRYYSSYLFENLEITCYRAILILMKYINYMFLIYILYFIVSFFKKTHHLLFRIY